MSKITITIEDGQVAVDRADDAEDLDFVPYTSDNDRWRQGWQAMLTNETRGKMWQAWEGVSSDLAAGSLRPRRHDFTSTVLGNITKGPWNSAADCPLTESEGQRVLAALRAAVHLF